MKTLFLILALASAASAAPMGLDSIALSIDGTGISEQYVYSWDAYWQDWELATAQADGWIAWNPDGSGQFCDGNVTTPDGSLTWQGAFAGDAYTAYSVRGTWPDAVITQVVPEPAMCLPLAVVAMMRRKR